MTRNGRRIIRQSDRNTATYQYDSQPSQIEMDSKKIKSIMKQSGGRAQVPIKKSVTFSIDKQKVGSNKLKIWTCKKDDKDTSKDFAPIIV